ncbi:MAG: YjbE family putative metal transport protein [Caulobacteraceae bacterium]
MHWASLFAAFAQVVLIDLTLASDNAIAIGMAAAGLPAQQRRLAIVLGLGAAVVLLCGLAFFAVELLKIGGPGLVLAGGLLLLLICWQLWKDLRARARGEDRTTTTRKRKTLTGALVQIFIADISTSLDNVLAVAGAVRNQPPWVLFAGLGLSVVLTGFAATLVSKLLQRLPWIGYIGLAIVLFVSGHMIWDGVVELGWLKAMRG